MLTDPYGTGALTRSIIGCAIRVHGVIGPGVFENVYAECLAYELAAERLEVARERPVPLVYRGARLRARYYVDLVVENLVIVELKAVERLIPIHERQVLTEVKLAGLPVGLLINFNVPRLMDGVKRIVNPQFCGGRRETP